MAFHLGQQVVEVAPKRGDLRAGAGIGIKLAGGPSVMEVAKSTRECTTTGATVPYCDSRIAASAVIRARWVA
jgi:hypothetical protein